MDKTLLRLQHVATFAGIVYADDMMNVIFKILSSSSHVIPI